MNLFIYSDESGVFDSKHNDYFVFGGLICFGRKQKELISRNYSHIEKVLRNSRYSAGQLKEIKASNITNSEKGKLYRGIHNTYKFSVIVRLKDLDQKIFNDKKHKQRYMDFAYKMVLKKCLKTLINANILEPKTVENIYVCVDEHTTATDGIYELKENLLREFKIGTFNPTFQHYFDPIFPELKSLEVQFCNSSKKLLIRAADIIANHAYHKAITEKGYVRGLKNTFILYMPSNQVGSKGFEYFEKKEAE